MLLGRGRNETMKLIVTAMIILLAGTVLSGCIGKSDTVYSISDIYQNPGKFKDSKGVSQIIKIQGVAGTDPIYEIANPGSYYFLAPDDENAPPNEIIYVSAVNGAPASGSDVVVEGKIDKVLDTGKVRIVTFIPDNSKK